MKKIFLSIMTILSIFGASSCSDMLETDNDRQLIDPSLNQKTDSIFYALGILQAVQQVADQYVYTGEMRGDLVTTTDATDKNLRQLYQFQASTDNKYDSAYVYYRIINNCNYYIANRDTTLLTGSTKVVMPEYVAVKSIRAWAYLQLARNYGKVPFFTEPLTSISQIENSKFEEKDLGGIVAALAPDLRQYSGMDVPTNGMTNVSVDGKNITAKFCYIPVDVILGDLYLENGQYEEAAKSYANYLIINAKTQNYSSGYGNQFYNARTLQSFNSEWRDKVPNDLNHLPQGASSWSTGFTVTGSTSQDIVTYIPMAVNSRKGTVTTLPAAFGFNYYTTDADKNAILDEVQIQPSSAFYSLTKSQDFYYYTDRAEKNVGEAKMGDTRMLAYLNKGMGEDSTKVYMFKYKDGNIFLYRTSTIYLRLAEALNRMGYPDAAFAILKEGISDQLLTLNYPYITEATRELLQTTIPFLSEANISNFTSTTSTGLTITFAGIHAHGAGVTADGNYPGRSPYQLDTIAGVKMKEIAEKFNVAVGTDKLDSINAVEDLICDEYALESAFEGNRYTDLLRLARHKNGHAVSSSYNGSPAGYGADFGTQWLVKKLTLPGRDASILNDKSKWYLPFK